jgi:uncharacterized protein YwgA/O-acetyl-ADP-ribose deacetylase (regulator of RNase III)
MIKVLVGDIFNSKAQTLVNTVNCVGIMGKGLALAFKNKYSDMFIDYEQKCKQRMVKLGKPYLYKSLFPPHILLFPTKDHWRSVSNIHAIEEGLQYLKKNYKDWGITSIAVPPLGCGLGELDWNIVGPTLYRHLKELDIEVELYAPFGTPHKELTPEFLGEQSKSQQDEKYKTNGSKIDPGLISVVEVIRRIEKSPYHWPIGRVMFQKLTYFATELGLQTGLTYRRASFGPFADELKSKIARLSNNGIITERQSGRSFIVNIGKTFTDAKQVFEKELSKDEQAIERLVDLFSRINSNEAEIAATVHFARKTMKLNLGEIPSEYEVLQEVLEWKKRHRPPYKPDDVARAIRQLAILGWLEVKPSNEISKQLEVELEA